MEGQTYTRLETTADEASSSPRTLIVVSPKDSNRAKVERVFSTLGLPEPYVARSTDEGREQATKSQYDLIIADVQISVDQVTRGLVRFSNLAERAFIAVDSMPGRGYLDVDSPRFREQLAEAVYSQYRRMLVMEAERGEEYQKALERYGEVLVRRDEKSALATLGEGGIDLMIIGHGIDYTDKRSLSYGLRTVEEAHRLYPGVPILLQTVHPEHLKIVEYKARQNGAYGVVTRSDDLTKLAAKTVKALKGKKPQSLMTTKEKAETTKPFSDGIERESTSPLLRGISPEGRAALDELLKSAKGRTRLARVRAKHGSLAL